MSMMKEALLDETYREIARVSKETGVDRKMIEDFFFEELERGAEWYDALWDCIDFAYDVEAGLYDSVSAGLEFLEEMWSEVI